MSTHDACVREWINLYRSQGWTVYADVPGYPKPTSISNKIPDIYARTDSQEHVIEVETDETINIEQTKQQIATFKRWATQSTYRRFKLSMANASGCKELSV